MRGVHVDAEHAVDLMRCEVEIDSALNACGRALTVFLRRRANPSDTEHAAALGISNTLWAGSVLLVRYLQAFPALLPGGDDEDGGAGPVSGGQGKRRARVVEVGAGLGAGGIGVGVLARELRRCMTPKGGSSCAGRRRLLTALRRKACWKFADDDADEVERQTFDRRWVVWHGNFI